MSDGIDHISSSIGEQVDYQELKSEAPHGAPTGVADNVPPFGLVKVAVDQKSNPQVKGTSTFLVTAIGKDAKSTITKPPKPFDQATLMKQMMGGAGAGGAGPGGAPKPASAPAQAPAPAAAPKK